MVFQQQSVQVAQLGHHAPLLGFAQRKAFVGVAAQPAIQPHRPLRGGLQPLGQHGKRHAPRCMQMDHTLYIRPGCMHRTMNGKATGVDAGARAIDHLARNIDLDQR
ncbi:hypothetical protein D3C72_1971300 [compost metagenome]